MFIEIAIALVILLGSFCVANERAVLPGTSRYIDKERERQIAMEIAMTRQNLVLSRLRLKESENIDRILALPAASEKTSEGDISSEHGNNGGHKQSSGQVAESNRTERTVENV